MTWSELPILQNLDHSFCSFPTANFSTVFLLSFHLKQLPGRGGDSIYKSEQITYLPFQDPSALCRTHICSFWLVFLLQGATAIRSGLIMSECPRWRKNWSIKEYGEHGNGLWTNQSHNVCAYSTGLARAWVVEWLIPKNELIHFVVLKKCKGKKSIFTLFY